MKSTKLTVFLIIIAIAAGWTGRGILEQNKKEALVKAIATIQMEVPMTALELLEKEEYKDLRYHLGLRMCDGFITYENNNFLGEDEETIELFEQSYALSGHLLKQMQSEPDGAGQPDNPPVKP